MTAKTVSFDASVKLTIITGQKFEFDPSDDAPVQYRTGFPGYSRGSRGLRQRWQARVEGTSAKNMKREFLYKREFRGRDGMHKSPAVYKLNKGDVIELATNEWTSRSRVEQERTYVVLLEDARLISDAREVRTATQPRLQAASATTSRRCRNAS